MSGIVVQTKALKTVNKRGGTKTHNLYALYDEEDKLKLASLEEWRKTKNGPKPFKVVAEQKFSGSDYVVFVCPWCDSRNKRVIHDAKPAPDSRVSFKCNKCYRVVEVEKRVNVPTILSPLKLVDGYGKVI